MINLGSKNPILRFKLGKKIKMFKNPNEGITLSAPKEEKKGDYYRVNRNGKWVWGTWVFGSNKNKKVFIPITKQVVLDDGTILNTNGTRSTARARALVITNRVKDSMNSFFGHDDNSSKTKSTSSGTSKTGKGTGGTGGTTATKTEPAAQTYTVPEGIDNIKAVQLSLLDGGFYDENYVKSGANVVDGKWGKYTDAAYKAWLEKAKAAKDPIRGIGTIPGLGVTNSLFNTQTPVNIPYFSNYDYGRGNSIKSLGFNNYKGLVDFVKSNKDDLFARDLVERFGDVNNWKQADVEGALGVSGLYRRGILGDYSDISRSMADWATNKNKEAAAVLSALKQNTTPVNNNTSASTPSYNYLRSKFFNTYNSSNLFPSYTPTMGTASNNYFTTYNSENTLLPTNSINRFKLSYTPTFGTTLFSFKKGGSIRKFRLAGQVTYPKWEVPRTVATGYGFQNANDTQINLPNVTVTADYKLIIRDKASKRNSKLANFLHALWKVGAFKGVKDKYGKEATYKSAVDGIEGNMTRTAIANAQKMGYNVDVENGTISTKKHIKVPKPLKQQNVSEEPKVDNSRNLLAVLNHDRLYNVEGRKWYFDPTTNTGYRLEDGKIVDLFEITTGLNTSSDGYTPLTKDDKGRPVYDRATNLSSTPAGIFTFSRKVDAYGEPMYMLIEGQRGLPGTPGKSTNIAFHAPSTALRAALFDDGNIKNNCTSFGCISPKKGNLTSWYNDDGSFARDTVIIGPKDPRNYIYIDHKDGLLKSHFGYAPREVSGNNYDKHYHFTDVKYNRGY